MQIPATPPSIAFPVVQRYLNAAPSAPKSLEKDSTIAPTSLSTSANSDKKTQANSTELTEEDKRVIAQLKTSDREVRAHEAAHLAAAGGLARGGASFTYQAGPDGRRYAVGGEVSIDTSPVRDDPQATIQKAQTIRAAALAPANPSGADRSVAAAAGQLEASARAELSAKRTDEIKERQQETQESQQNDSKVGAEVGTEGRIERGIENGSEEKSESSQTAAIETPSTAVRPDVGINDYQAASDPQAPSDLLGQLLNIST
ncbi:MAG: hypothetical protein COB30_020775 [Ectothiorhodospiraceae bacterium]|nr:hypothetical protein [Ectothiorhodospiraceae bacterium]